MSYTHAQGKLEADARLNLVDKHGNIIARLACTTGKYESEELNARRLVACWNACESFSTEMLEGAMSAVVQGGFVGMWSNYCDKKSEAEDLRAQRDELLAACVGALTEIKATGLSEGVFFGPDPDIEVKLRAAIAKAGGPAS